MSFSRGPARTRRHIVTFAARLRIDRAPRKCAGRSGLARPALGLNFFISRWKVLQKMAKGNSLSRYGCVWQTARFRDRRHSDGTRGIVETRRVLLQAAAQFGSTSCRSLRAWIEAKTICN